MLVRYDQAARRLRPFALRREITARPLLVAIRDRKPWVRLRLRTLGWKVLFISLLALTRSAYVRTYAYIKGRSF